MSDPVDGGISLKAEASEADPFDEAARELGRLKRTKAPPHLSLRLKMNGGLNPTASWAM